MAPLSSMLLLLAASLLALVSQAASSQAPAPTAVRKLSPDSSEKILAQYLGFAPQDAQDAGYNDTQALYRPAFARHFHGGEGGAPRRATEVLALLEKRSSCPAGMSSCADQGSPNKCCQEGTYCTDVPDAAVGHVACCPQGNKCGGGVGSCPRDAASCPPALGGGCCIPGYVCQGLGCVRSAVVSDSHPHATTPTPTPTTTSTVGGSVSTTSVTPTATPTSKSVATASGTDSATGNPAWRPTGSSDVTTSEPSTQAGCPTGFYGCLARHGGGCCRTDRDCHTSSCPPSPSTTLVSNGATIVVPATDPPGDGAAATCAGGWFMCSASAGCCPSGYECGTASCFTVQASQTAGSVQKEAPEKGAGGRRAAVRKIILGGAAGACFLLGLAA